MSEIRISNCILCLSCGEAVDADLVDDTLTCPECGEDICGESKKAKVYDNERTI